MLDYNISHKVLLFRKNDSYQFSQPNVDLIFESVFYMELPTSLENICIYEASNTLVQEVELKFGQTIYQHLGYKVYVIECNQNAYYVGCSRYILKENRLPYTQSSIK